ncbi:PhoH family protein [Gaiella sp.]|uniref:PhoH family protein n=1 Tax=Gaiella sp. TaxID=2663207 RepID=UPI002E35CC43|nr:PhoH family protein [Gaiella sp.]HEX5583498.1 PhoH family protein [Gaiella sp.]
MQDVLTVPNEVAAELAGVGDGVLDTLRERLGCTISLRGNRLTLDGDDERVVEARAVVDELVELVEGGHAIGPDTVGAVVAALDQAEDIRDVFDDVVWRHRGKKIAPKTVTQKRYVDTIRSDTVTFAIGPAGTGKTYLAIALAVKALSEREVGRIILTRPAVEAGERLGFLPGDVLAKVDPYMRPLFDALYDTMDADRLNAYIDRGTIEVAPLAFMRGRAQPVDRQVLTPSGWQEIGSLRVGDLVIGSGGRPTPVLGVYQQGPRPVFRLTAQDGATTVCCGEHLWRVTTPDDRRRGRQRVVRTDEMVGRLRQRHQHRFELPLVEAPVELMPQEVPLDPYALGLLLGDGCLTTSTTPGFTTADPELAEALESRLPGIELRHKDGFDYVLRHVDGGRGGVIVANPVTVVLRQLAPAGRLSGTKFVPEQYLINSPDVRLGVLQGLLDTDGGPVVQRGRTCRIQYSTSSERLRDDVVFLVRSLGGVAYGREGRAPGHARGRAVHHRADAFILDIRLPAGIQPFRLRRKLERYHADGGGRPMRFVDKIEPLGDAETVCIQVAAADSLYVTDDFLVTHNTLNDSFVILDEAQNTTPEQMQMFLTRLGFGSKMVVTGDVTQVDLPREQASGLIQVRTILQSLDGIGFVEFGHEDVVRHKLVQRIVEAYKRHAEETGSTRHR